MTKNKLERDDHTLSACYCEGWDGNVMITNSVRRSNPYKIVKPKTSQVFMEMGHDTIDVVPEYEGYRHDIETKFNINDEDSIIDVMLLYGLFSGRFLDDLYSNDDNLRRCQDHIYSKGIKKYLLKSLAYEHHKTLSRNYKVSKISAIIDGEYITSDRPMESIYTMVFKLTHLR